ncbi:YdcF family protein [Niveibacterium sp. SC-1]|uniref:YdcF family protein n=1 Tax=Niveibacterium sp. SC-1 TaxID=3135646 RepID=UPI00311FD4EA
MSPLLFLAKKLAGALLLPPLLPLWIIALGLLLLKRRPRTGRALAWLGVATGLALCLPVTVGSMVMGLERDPPLSPEAARGAQAIVILGAGKQRYAPEYGGPTVNALGLARVRYGALLARQYHLPILVSGGAPTGNEPEAELMRQVLEREYDLHPRWTENRSRDTGENAIYSAALLRQAGVQRVLLVTHAAHMSRARAEFEHQGLEVVAAPTAFLTAHEDVPPGDEDPLAILPTANVAYAGWIAMYEWLGLFAQRLFGPREASASTGQAT